MIWLDPLMQTSTTTFTWKVKALLILSSWHTARPVFTSSALHWLCQAVNLSWLFAIQFHKSSLIIRQIMLVGHFPISEEQTPSSDVYDSAALAIFKEWGIDPEGPAENDCINPIFRSLPNGSKISSLQPFSNYRNYLGGILYVGDQRAAKDSTLLTRCPRSVI